MSVISGIRGGLTSDEVIALIGRNKPDGTAGLYTCKTILNEHRPVCTKEYHLIGNQLDGQSNPDVWFHIPGAGDGSIVYSNRFLTLTSGTGATSATRCVIDQTKFPINGNFLEVTCRLGPEVLGQGGERRTVFGFAPAFSSFQIDTIGFVRPGTAVWHVMSTLDNWEPITGLPLGRNLTAGDIITVRLDRQEGSPNIDIARFYVNGQKQYETTHIPTQNCYAGIGVFTDASTTSARAVSIDYFGVKFVP